MRYLRGYEDRKQYTGFSREKQSFPGKKKGQQEKICASYREVEGEAVTFRSKYRKAGNVKTL